MDGTFWFYTLSAVPQTLAAILAVVCTFVVFKLDSLDEKITDEANQIKTFLLPLFPSWEIDYVENLSTKGILQALSDGVATLDKQKNDLGAPNYTSLRDLVERVISDWRRSISANPERVFHYLNHKLSLFGRLLEKRNNVIKQLKLSLFLISGPLVFSLLLLPYYKYLSVFADYIVPVIIISSVIAIGYTAKSVYSIATR